MSDVTRYTAAGNGVVRTDTDGALVSFDDYAWLHYENARLKAEVERLTDAITRGASTPDAHPHA